MIRSYKFALYPSKKQSEDLLILLNLLRQFYNACLQERIEAYKKNGTRIDGSQQKKNISEIRKSCPEYGNVSNHLMQDVVNRLDRAFDNFFRRVELGQKPGFPRYKSIRKFKSFKFQDAGRNSGVAVIYENKDCKIKSLKETTAISLVSGRKRLRIQNIGNAKIKLHRDMEGCLKTVSIIYENGKWFAVFVRDKIEFKPKEKTGKETGIDVGVKYFATLSDGSKIENPKHLKKAECDLKRLQRKLSGQVRGSGRYQITRHKLANQYKHLANCRKDFLHKESRKIANTYDFVSIENLNIPQMVQSGNLAKEILDAGWGSFAEKLAYKVEETGGEFVRIDPAYTSQDCSSCGNRVKKDLSERVHDCPCGLILDRDHNAALNILRIGKCDLVKIKDQPAKPKKLSFKRKTRARTEPSERKTVERQP